MHAVHVIALFRQVISRIKESEQHEKGSRMNPLHLLSWRISMFSDEILRSLYSKMAVSSKYTETLNGKIKPTISAMFRAIFLGMLGKMLNMKVVEWCFIYKCSFGRIPCSHAKFGEKQWSILGFRAGKGKGERAGYLLHPTAIHFPGRIQCTPRGKSQHGQHISTYQAVLQFI